MSFKSLVCAVSVQCQEIKQALASISYFDSWDSEVVGECCRVSSVAEYPPDTIILGPGTGTSHTVYFILEGVCKMIQNLLVEMKRNSRQRELYKLYGPLDSKTLRSKATNEGYSSRLLNQKQLVEEAEFSKEGKEEAEGTKSRKADFPDSEEEESNSGGIKDDPLTEMPAQNDSQVEILTVDSSEGSPEEKKGKGSTEDPKADLVHLGKEGTKSGREFLYEPDHHLKVLEACKEREKERTGVCRKGPLPEKPKNVECFFVQTAFLYKGACFGLEKCQKENFIMSTAKVKCLKIPRRFLFKHNPCYTWNRIALFHRLYLPKEEEILERLRSDRMWIRGKEKQSEAIVSSRNIPNYTLICEAPYSIRLAEVQLL